MYLDVTIIDIISSGTKIVKTEKSIENNQLYSPYAGRKYIRKLFTAFNCGREAQNGCRDMNMSQFCHQTARAGLNTTETFRFELARS